MAEARPPHALPQDVDPGVPLSRQGSSWLPAWRLCCWGRQTRLPSPRSSSRPKAKLGPLSRTQRRLWPQTEPLLSHDCFPASTRGNLGWFLSRGHTLPGQRIQCLTSDWWGLLPKLSGSPWPRAVAGAASVLGQDVFSGTPLGTLQPLGAPCGSGMWPWGVPSLGRDDELMGLPSWDPEPDRDSLYHPPPEEAQAEAGLRSWSLPPHQELQGPEEDRDHIYHPRDDS
ncbi:proline-rich acidic protein 1 isoform X1 [Panthera tigris]|uniref:proline-rich acidic protein 1 isoform X1 n=1 Tax=Panthera leo TaxID=9689 RepID=UPI001C6A812C|nr:proline-rich acidic protein 1 isoform X1 [Panthera leo]XP_042817005.1 proline-rich acidic protein 1 isoform X1 [Panthera tigris]